MAPSKREGVTQNPFTTIKVAENSGIPKAIDLSEIFLAFSVDLNTEFVLGKSADLQLHLNNKLQGLQNYNPPPSMLGLSGNTKGLQGANIRMGAGWLCAFVWRHGLSTACKTIHR